MFIDAILPALIAVDEVKPAKSKVEYMKGETRATVAVTTLAKKAPMLLENVRNAARVAFMGVLGDLAPIPAN